MELSKSFQRSWFIGLLILLCCSAGVSFAQDTAPDVAELVKRLEKFERSFHGMKVIFTSPTSMMQPVQVRISRNGKAMIVEKQLASGSGKTRQEVFIGCFHCPLYSVQINKNTLGGTPYGSIVTGSLSPKNPVAKESHGDSLLGYSTQTLEKFSSMATRPKTTVSVEPAHLFGQDGFALEITSKGLPNYTFFWGNERPEHLLGYSYKYERGDEFAYWEGTLALGEKKPESWNMADQSAYTSGEALIGPIEYDDQDRPRMVPINATANRGDEVEHYDRVESVVSCSPLAEDDGLEDGRMILTIMDVPARLPVKIFNSSVPHELRDGRLVSILDGQAVAVGKSSGFRSPKGIPRYIYIIGAIIAIGIIAFGIARLRERKS